MMSQIDDYINGVIDESPENSFHILWAFITGDPERERLFITSSLVKTAFALLEKAGSWFEEYFPKADFKNFLDACVTHEHPKTGLELLKSNFPSNQEAFSILTHSVCYALTVFDEINHSSFWAGIKNGKYPKQ